MGFNSGFKGLSQEQIKWLPFKQVLLLPGFSRRAGCHTIHCHHVTVDGQNKNITLLLTSLGNAIAQSVIRWWRKVIVGRRSHILDRTRHIWCRSDKTRRERVGRRYWGTLSAAAIKAADNHEERDQASERNHVPYHRPWIQHPLPLWKKENRCQVSVQVSTGWNKASSTKIISGSAVRDVQQSLKVRNGHSFVRLFQDVVSTDGMSTASVIWKMTLS